MAEGLSECLGTREKPASSVLVSWDPYTHPELLSVGRTAAGSSRVDRKEQHELLPLRGWVQVHLAAGWFQMTQYLPTMESRRNTAAVPRTLIHYSQSLE